jgi:hypothetical protein
MRKTLLIAAAALAASVISSRAQVYSQNIVGYVNVPLTTGYSALANQLDFDGTGTNNTVETVFGTNLLASTTVLAWEPGLATYTSATWINSKGTFKWSGNTNGINAALNVGGGVFVSSPATNNVTLVGTVIQGTNVIALTTGYNLVSPIQPIAGGLQTTLGFSPVVGDTVLEWTPAGQTYVAYNYISSKGTLKWNPSEPQIAVGQSFFVQAPSAQTWTNTFVAP